MHINKVASVMTVDRVAAQLGESVDFLYDVANEMDPEDGVIWVYGAGDTKFSPSPTSASKTSSNSSKSTRN